MWLGIVLENLEPVATPGSNTPLDNDKVKDRKEKR